MSRAGQSGYALLALLLLMTSISAGIFVGALNQQNETLNIRAQREIQQGMRDAKLALVAHALIEDNTPGTLASPSAEGAVDGNSSPLGFTGTPGQSARRLPWRFLGLNPRIDGECLWYAVSNVYRNANLNTESRRVANGNAINPATPGALSVSLQTGVPSIAAAAVLIAPGSALNGQTTSRLAAGSSQCAGGVAMDFLENSNAGISGAFVDKSVAESDALNDTLLPITHSQILRPVLRRALSALKPEALRNEIRQRMSTSSTEGKIADLRCQADAQGGCQGSTDFDALLAQTDKTSIVYFSGTNCPGIDQGAGPNYKQPVSWLCFNDWYSHIRYQPDEQRLIVSLAPYSNSECSMVLATGSIQCKN